MENIGPIAVIDIGAHFVRLEIAQPEENDKNYTTLERLSQIVPLGQDVFTGGKISTSNTLLVCKILKDYSHTLSEYGVEHLKAVATSAVREASNSEIFIDRIKRITGIEVRILESSEEARVMFLAMKEFLSGLDSFSSGNIMTCALGTGSTQISVIQNGLLKSSEAVRIGSLRIIEELGHPASSKQLKKAIKPFVGSKTRGVFIQAFNRKIDNLVAVGSSTRAILKFKKNCTDNGTLSKISKDELKDIYNQIESMSPIEIADKLDISETLAESIEPCCGIIYHLLKVTKVNELIVPQVSTRDAIIKDFLRELRGDEDPFIPDLISCVHNIGKRYNYDESHAETVTEKAMMIFEKTHPLHGITNKEKIYLHAAAILHDIGLFVNSRRHHKHSYYIISNSQIPGLSNKERELVACIARYHRSAMPKNSHLEYSLLTPDEKVLVSDLAAMLRVADSLEFAHNLKIKDVILNYRAQVIEIIVDGFVDIILENWALKTKANLFKEVFGFKIQITGK